MDGNNNELYVTDRASVSEERMAQKKALCIKAYQTDKEYHLKLQECDVVTLIKDEAKDELWYGESNGKEGYFEQNCVVLMPMSLSHLQLSSEVSLFVYVVSFSHLLFQQEWKRINLATQKMEFKKGDVICNANDLATIGMLYFVMQGVCVQTEDEHPIYFTECDVFGELGVLCGTKMGADVVVFSERAVITQMDCREGSSLNALLENDVELSSRLFRYVAGVCATRLKLLEELVHHQELAKAVVREKIKKKPRKKKQAQKMEFEGEGIVEITPEEKKIEQATAEPIGLYLFFCLFVFLNLLPSRKRTKEQYTNNKKEVFFPSRSFFRAKDRDNSKEKVYISHWGRNSDYKKEEQRSKIWQEGEENNVRTEEDRIESEKKVTGTPRS